MILKDSDFDAIIVGSGPNGLAAAIYLQQKGLSVLLIEGKEELGGGMRSAELTLPGFLHDICSAVHPLAVASPFLSTLPLKEHGLDFIYPEVAAAHPFDNGNAAQLKKSIVETIQSLGSVGRSYQKLIDPIVRDWPLINDDVLAPLHFPKHPLAMARFGFKALTSAKHLAASLDSPEARGLFAGMAAHTILPLTNMATSAAALVLLVAGHIGGWPIPKGGSGSIALSMVSYFKSIGGVVETGFFVKSLEQLPSAKAVLLDVTPRQLLQIAGHRFSPIYKWQLERYKYGMGVFKIDWALNAPIPFVNEGCRNAGTVHLGSTFEEIARAEQNTWAGKNEEKPFVLLAQPSVFDPGRAPAGKHTAWAYCHVPHGSIKDMTQIIENQVERYAPGFKDCILAKHTMDTRAMEEYNPNYIGGDIAGGANEISQLFTRPALRWSPYKTSAKGIYICSSSTPPGGGVHGMCGYHAAKRAFKDIFEKN